MKKIFRVCLKIILCFSFTILLFRSVYAEDFNSEITTMSGKLTQKLIAREIKKIAVADFVDLQGRPTELGKYIAEELSVQMVNEEGITVLDRANFKSILAEHNLSLEGFIKPENAKELGKFAGIDAIITGTLTILNSNVVLTVKVISTESAQIVAAAKATFINTSEFQQLSNKAAFSASNNSVDNNENLVSKSTNSDMSTIATKDIGDLRVALKNVRLVKDENGFTAAQWVFDFINTNLKNSMLLACTGYLEDRKVRLKGQITDFNGNIWMFNKINGLSYVRGAGVKDGSQIVQCISKGNNFHEEFYDPQEVFISYSGSNEKPRRKTWTGSFTEIPATQSKRITMLFSDSQNQSYGKSNKHSESFQFECELIIGAGSVELPEECSSTLLMFDDVSISNK